MADDETGNYFTKLASNQFITRFFHTKIVIIKRHSNKFDKKWYYTVA